MTRLKITLYATLLLFVAGVMGASAQITWGPAQFMLGNNDVSNTGVAFDAATFNGSTPAVNGVTFNPLVASGTVGGLTGYSDGKIAANSPSGAPGTFTTPFATAAPSSAAYSAAVSTLGFAYGYNGTVVISGLTTGHTYQVQVWSYFTGSPGNSNTTLTGANTVTLIPDTGEFAIGTFTAASSSVTFNYNCGLAYGIINAISVRDTSGSSGGAPAAPTGLAATAGNTQVALSWTASTGATSYNVYRGTTAGGESATAIATGISSTSYTNTGLTNGTAYYYKVAAVNTSGTSGYSTEASATPAATGSNLISNGTYEIVAQSSALAMAVNGTSNGSAVSQQTYTGASVQQWVLNNLGNNVVSLEVSGTSEALEVPGSSQSLGAMLDVSAYTGGTNQQWTIISVGSGCYEVVNVNSGQEVNVAYGSTSPGGQLCQYTAGNYANGVWSFTLAGSGGGSAPTAPTNLTAAASNAQIALSWTVSTGATSYNVYRGTTAGGESTTALATGISSTSYTDTGLTNGTAYYYKVTAVNTSGMSGYSAEASATPSAGGSYLISNGTYKVVAQSSGLAMAANGTSNGSAVSQQTYTGASSQQWVLNNLGNNVVSLEVSGTSEALEVPGSSQTAGAMLDVSAYASGTNQQWTIVSVGNGYYEVVNVNSGQEVNVAYGSTSPGGPLCQYTAGNYANGVWSFTSASGGGSAPAAPTNLAATAGNAQVALSWTASSGATSYNVYRGTTAGGESATAIATGISSASYTNTGLTNGTVYYYTVKAVNSYGTSSASNEANATPSNGGGVPAAPTNLAATAGNSQVALSWTASSGATSYNVYRGTTAGGESATAVATGISSTSYTNTGLTNGTTYYYKVAAVNTTGTSAYSTEASATPTGGSGSSGSLVLAVGLEKIVSTYSGPLVQIENAGGNTLDVSFAPGSNALNMASVSAFLGTSQGWITKLYDQSGNGNTVLAPTTSGTDNMPTISMVAPTAITNSGTTYLTARNVIMPYGPNGETNNRYFIIPSSVSVDKSQMSAFLALRPDYSGGPPISLFEVGNPMVDAVDLVSYGNTGLEGLSHNSNVTFTNTNIMSRSQPTVLGMVTASGSAPTLYLDGVSHATGGSVPTSAICSGGYLMAGTGTALYYYYTYSLFAQYNFLGFALYNGAVSPSSAAAISNAMLPRTTTSINIVVDGDSITQGVGSTYGYQMIRYAEPLFNHPADITNIAIGGAPAGSAVSHVTYPTAATSAVGQLYNPSCSQNIYYVAIGTNDIHGNGTSGDQVWAIVQQALQGAKAMGYKTVVATILHENGETAGTSGAVDSFNALARAAVGQPYLDAVVDYSTDPRLGNINIFYPTYGPDGIHPDDAGYQIMGPIAATVFNSLIGP